MGIAVSSREKRGETADMGRRQSMQGTRCSFYADGDWKTPEIVGTTPR